MNKSILLFAAAMFAAGCASSERMMRLTDSYDAPSSSRTGGRQWDGAGGIGGTQINVWPLFVRSNRYYSVLWPLFDCDPYGMAIRPFFNQEGNDYSILFPLAAWNSERGSGWVLNTYWYGQSFGCFPLFHESDLGGYALPLTFWNRNKEDVSVVSVPLLSGYWDETSSDYRWSSYFSDDGKTSGSSLMLGKLMKAMDFKGDAANAVDREAFHEYLKQEIPGFDERSSCITAALVLNILGRYDYCRNTDSVSCSMLMKILFSYSDSPEYTSFSAVLGLFRYNYQEAFDPGDRLKDQIISIAFDEINRRMEVPMPDTRFGMDLKVQCAPLREELAKYNLTLSDNPDLTELFALAKCPMKGSAPVPAEAGWRVLWFLATGHTCGDCEERQVLWQVYNYKRNGESSLTRILPFITVRRESDSCETSWIWNKFMSIKNDADGTSGRFLFIPW